MVATRKTPRTTPDKTPAQPLDVRITERIVAALNNGIVPWQQAHHRLADGTLEAPCNWASGHRYTGQNLLLLDCNTHDRPYYLTYRQAQALGGQVRRGAKGEFITLWKFNDDKEETTGERRRAYCQVSYVFHLSDIDGIEVILPERMTLSVSDAERVALDQAQLLIDAYLIREQIRLIEQGLRASYSKELDQIRMPLKAAYLHPGAYYKTIFHEMIHATGAAHRLNRPDLVNNRGMNLTDRATYSREELTAEVGAAMLAMHCGLDHQPGASTENSAAYVADWAQFLAGDPLAFRTAIGHANKAVAYVLGVAHSSDPVSAE